MQIVVNIRLYENWHEQAKIRKKRWNNKEIKKFYWKLICKQKRHWRNPVRTRVTPLDSSGALYIVFLAYTVKPMDNVVRFRHPCVGPARTGWITYSGVRLTHKCCKNAQVELAIVAWVKRTGQSNPKCQDTLWQAFIYSVLDYTILYRRFQKSAF
jgi:hypothetical protein